MRLNEALDRFGNVKCHMRLIFGLRWTYEAIPFLTSTKGVLRLTINSFSLARVTRREVKDDKLPCLCHAPEHTSLTGSKMIAPRCLIFIFVEKRGFAKEEVGILSQC